MGIRRALVVDDSKVARATLAKLLKKQGVEVDTTESAEAALDYLLTHKPDVIFLDHIMPGMDGFQAMRAIKQNPQTATIPIMMYTSKEGEVYVGQARALGAVGCLPKQVQPADVAEVLQRLGRMSLQSHAALSDDRLHQALRDEPANDRDAREEAARTQALRERVQVAVRPAETEAVQLALRKSLDEHRQQMREDLERGIEVATRKVLSEIAGHDETHADVAADAASTPPPALRAGGYGRPGLRAGLILLLLLPTLVLIKLYYDADAERAHLARQQQRLLDQQADVQANLQHKRTQSETLDARYRAALKSLETERARSLSERGRLLETVAWAFNEYGVLEYGQSLLDEMNLLRIRGLLERLDELGVVGTVQIRRHHGRFCLSGDETQGYHKPVDTLPLQECVMLQHVTAWHSADPLSLEQALNNELIRRGGGLRIRVTDLGEAQPRVQYPNPAAVRTAGEWNRIAQSNNRLEIAILTDELTTAPRAARPAHTHDVNLATY